MRKYMAGLVWLGLAAGFAVGAWYAMMTPKQVTPMVALVAICLHIACLCCVGLAWGEVSK